MADQFFSLPAVRDCLGRDFDDACTALARRVQLGCNPDLWVGIEAGGARILERMHSIGAVNAPCAFVKASRPATRQKQRPGLSALLSRMPRPVANAARIGEHVLRQWQFEKTRRSVPRDVSISSDTAAALEAPTRVVLIDDAIDSGSSVMQVIEAIKQINPRCSIDVAVIVQTFRHPLRQPEFVLYRDVLIRFPWSADAAR